MAITTKHQLLAWDLVEGLYDEAHKGVYFRLGKIYDETFLRGILSLVKDAVRRGQIKKEDGGRYFMGILKKELSSTASAMKDKEKVNLYSKNNGKNIKNSSRGRSGTPKKSRTGKKS